MPINEILLHTRTSGTVRTYVRTVRKLRKDKANASGTYVRKSAFLPPYIRTSRYPYVRTIRAYKNMDEGEEEHLYRSRNNVSPNSTKHLAVFIGSLLRHQTLLAYLGASLLTGVLPDILRRAFGVCSAAAEERYKIPHAEDAQAPSKTSERVESNKRKEFVVDRSTT